MKKIPNFNFFGDNNQNLLEQIQPSLGLRNWGELSELEKNTAFNELLNRGWIKEGDKILKTIQKLNHEFLRECPGKMLHERSSKVHYESDKYSLALEDFSRIFLQSRKDSLVYRMLSIFSYQFINTWHLDMLERGSVPDEKSDEYINDAFKDFDALAYRLNHIFEQFSVNITITRDGLFPKQDSVIEKNLVTPVLLKLSHPKWTNVNSDLSAAIDAYHSGDFPTSISLMHSGIQRFLQILLNQEEGKNGQGEFGKLISQARKEGILGNNEVSQAIESGLQSFISIMRASKSVSKPLVIEPGAEDTLLMINVTLLLIQQAKTK